MRLNNTPATLVADGVQNRCTGFLEACAALKQNDLGFENLIAIIPPFDKMSLEQKELYDSLETLA